MVTRLSPSGFLCVIIQHQSPGNIRSILLLNNETCLCRLLWRSSKVQGTKRRARRQNASPRKLLCKPVTAGFKGWSTYCVRGPFMAVISLLVQQAKLWWVCYSKWLHDSQLPSFSTVARTQRQRAVSDLVTEAPLVGALGGTCSRQTTLIMNCTTPSCHKYWWSLSPKMHHHKDKPWGLRHRPITAVLKY